MVTLNFEGEKHELLTEAEEQGATELNDVLCGVENMPRRIQRKRTKGWRMPEGAVYVGRGSKWGNVFTVKKYGREKAVEMFRDYIGHPNSPHGFYPHEIEELRGKNLVCWCRLDQECHADVLLRLANT